MTRDQLQTCHELGVDCATKGIDPVVTWLFLGGVLLALAAWLLFSLLRAADKPAPPVPTARRFYPCAERDCRARATRILLMVTTPTESRVMCDHDAARRVRLGQAVDLGPIFRGRA